MTRYPQLKLTEAELRAALRGLRYALEVSGNDPDGDNPMRAEWPGVSPAESTWHAAWRAEKKIEEALR